MALNRLTANHRYYQCYQDIQDRLTDIGGVNKYDEPNFLLVWGQGGDDRAFYRAGGAWDVEGIPSFTGYRNLLIGGGQACWCLLQWHDSAEYGTPETYYVMNYDEGTGLQTLGEYPYSGRYQLLYSLKHVERRGNELHVEIMTLNNFLLDTVVPIIKEARGIGWEKAKAALEEQKSKEDSADVARIEDVMRDNAVPYRLSTVAYNKTGCHSEAIDKRVVSMQMHWNEIMTNAKSFNKGFQSR
jgi:hypothetical protein